jgi:uncharacterized membrane protein HdeD (DUF308 family)
MSQMFPFLTGAVSLACLVVALFFLRFWRTTRDPFFVFFAMSFALEAISRAALAFVEVSEQNPVFYGLRVIAYGLIIVAIWQKNRR